MIKRFFYIILISLMMGSPVFGAAYTAYFADDGTDNIVDTWDVSECTEGDPCNTFTEMNKAIQDFSSSGNTLTIYLNSADTWTLTSNTGILIYRSNVTIDAETWGGGTRAIIDGNASYPNDQNVFVINVGGASAYETVSNITIMGVRIQNVHDTSSSVERGGGIIFNGYQNFGNTATVQNCQIVDMGSDSIRIYRVANSGGTSTAIKLENNLFDGARWYNHITGLGNAVQMISTNDGVSYGHEARYNVLKESHGEGFGALGFSVIEYNVISNTKNPAIYWEPYTGTFSVTSVIRYNLIWNDSNGTHDFANTSAIRIDDESNTGTNTSVNIEIYGNVVAGYYMGIDLRNRSGNSHWGSVKAYNNTLIDGYRNFVVNYPAEFNAFDIRNNISVVNSDVASSAVHQVVWNTGTYPVSTTIGPNFWYGDSYTSEANLPADWRDGTNVFGASNPFSKTSGWRSLTTAPAMSNFTPSGTAIDSANAADLTSYDDLVSSSSAYEWTDVPTTGAFTLIDQDVAGEEDFGAIVVSAGSEPIAPSPDPMTFATAPSGLSTTEIDMTATTASDDTPPISYNFDYDPASDSCGSNADIGTGGTDSGWQSDDTTYTDGTLQVNQYYCYNVQARDADVPTAGTVSSTAGAYTLAAVPAAITFENEGANSVEILAHDENGNPAATPETTFAIQCVSASPADTNWENKWVQADGTAGGSAAWMTDAAITALTLSGMDDGTIYGFRSKARNGDSTETALGTLSYASTTGAPTPPPLVTGLGIVAAGCKFE